MCALNQKKLEKLDVEFLARIHDSKFVRVEFYCILCHVVGRSFVLVSTSAIASTTIPNRQYIICGLKFNNKTYTIKHTCDEKSHTLHVLLDYLCNEFCTSAHRHNKQMPTKFVRSFGTNNSVKRMETERRWDSNGRYTFIASRISILCWKFS